MNKNTKINFRPYILFLILFLAPVLMGIKGCDKEHKKLCEWYIMPDEDPKREVDEGFIPVCARNLIVNKQNCRLQMNLESAKSIYGKKFIYDEFEIIGGIKAQTLKVGKSCGSN